MSLVFQPYRDSDKNYLWTTYVEAMKLHISKIWGWDTAWQEDDFGKGLQKYDTFILLDNDCRIGYLQVECNNDSTFISMIILEPSCRSKGYGPKLLAQVQDFYPDKPLTLRRFQVNRGAHEFYIRCGFDIVDSDDYFISMCRFT